MTQTNAAANTSPHVMIPKPDELDLDLYQAIVNQGKICMQRCSSCSMHTHPPRYYCPSCSSPLFTFAPVSGLGIVYSYTVSHMSVEPAWQPLVPFLTLVVELQEGPRIVATARNIDLRFVNIGLPVRVITEAKGTDFAIFWAEPQ
jgi:uncharacterized OB-fold protein